MKCKTISFVKCTFVLNTVQRVCCVWIGLKILCKKSFNISARSWSPNDHKHCQTGFFKEKRKKNYNSNFQKCFSCQTLNNVHMMNCFSNMQCLWCVFLSRLSTTLIGKCLRWEELWVVRAGRCVFVWSVITCLFPPYTHNTMCNHAISTMWWPAV